jgi:hypothetical protein
MTPVNVEVARNIKNAAIHKVTSVPYKSSHYEIQLIKKTPDGCLFNLSKFRYLYASLGVIVQKLI